uniref:Uncharacterized protein n=1 Tax=Trichobilharzia regenti TaxID=157069 RepID=A0AA85JMC1_TRIRE|nr:unnamed protein product [Trichobilharzia regenti]
MFQLNEIAFQATESISSSKWLSTGIQKTSSTQCSPIFAIFILQIMMKLQNKLKDRRSTEQEEEEEDEQ